jgi:hypothetical protein
MQVSTLRAGILVVNGATTPSQLLASAISDLAKFAKVKILLKNCRGENGALLPY